MPIDIDSGMVIEVSGKRAHELSLADLGPFDYPTPTHLHQANGFYLPNGVEPGRGWFLLRRGDIDDIDLNGTHTVTMGDRRNGRQTLYRLVISAQPIRVIAGQNDDPNGLYLVELADQRWQCQNPHYVIPLNKHYNVRANGWPNGDFYADSLDAGSTWTWETMIGDVWNVMADQLGTFPGLPVAPAGIPENWRFVGTSAWQALNDLLYRIGCQIAVNLFLSTNQFAIVRIGDADADTELRLERIEDRKLQDRQLLDIYRGRTPYGVKVLFRAEWPHGTARTLAKDDTQWSTRAVHTVDVSGPATVTGYADPGVYHPIYDDAVALYDTSGTLLNDADLDARAQERADDFYRMLIDGGTLRILTYSTLEFARIRGTFKAIAWRQASDGGLVTDFICHPWRDVRQDERGQWQTIAHLRPPDFGPTWPSYPNVEHIVNISGTYGADPAGATVYSATVEHKDMVTGDWRRECECHVIDANDATLSTRRYKAKANGSFAGKPLLITAEESLPGANYEYGGRKGRFCIDVEKQKCVDGVLIDDSISIQSDVPIWMSRARCDHPTGQGGGDGGPSACQPGWVDTSACSPNDCQQDTWQIVPGQLDTVTNGTCGICANWHRGFTLNYRGSCEWLSAAGPSDGCGTIGVRLYYSAPYYRLVFTDGAKSIQYVLSGLFWAPGGPNTLSRLGVANVGWCDGWPDFVNVS